MENYKICVPDQYMADCKQMVEAGAASGAGTKLQCIGARDRVDCMYKIQNNVADFTYMDPEDMYIVSEKFDSNFIVFKEVRIRSLSEAEFRYNAMVIVKNGLNLKDLHSIKGLKSCHTGVGRMVGYKVPLTKLKKFGVIKPIGDANLSQRENELKTYSELFSKSCIVGQWSPDAKVNEVLKKKYSNLCALCEDPAKCDYPDVNSGYDGSLNCLTKAGGEIAFTKLSYIREHFGLSPNSVVKAPADQYSFLCPDAKTMPITETKPCTWSTKPWAGYVGNVRIEADPEDLTRLRNYISTLSKIGESSGSAWLTTVLGLDVSKPDKNKNTIPVENKQTYHPKIYLTKSNFEDIIGRKVEPNQPIRWCVTSKEAMEKCVDFKDASFSRGIRPTIECVRGNSTSACLKLIASGVADVINVDSTQAILARKNNMRPILKEVYGNDTNMLAVAVVNKNSKVKKFEELKGLKSCHTAYMCSTGWVAPVNTLLGKNLIKKDDCPYVKGMAEFFSGGSCVPGVNEKVKDAPASLVKICPDASKDYSPLQCIKSGDADVAFVSHAKVMTAVETGLLKADEIEYVCSKGGRSPITKATECNLGIIPSHMIVTSNAKSNLEIDTIRYAILEAAETFASKPKNGPNNMNTFKLFGSFMGKSDLLFWNQATNVAILPDQPTDEENNFSSNVLSKVMHCN